MIDSGVAHPNAAELLKPTLSRLGKRFASWNDYWQMMKNAPFFQGWWEPEIESYFRADIEQLADGSVRVRSQPEQIQQAWSGSSAVVWSDLLGKIRQPTLLLNATEPYGAPGSPPLIVPEATEAMAKAMPDCKYVQVPGNHVTMLYGAAGKRVAGEIVRFLG